jgi:DNA-damage-inducible protein D
MSNIKLFEEKRVRSIWNEIEQQWYFSIVDVIEVLTNSPNPPVYWRVLKKRLSDEGNETVTNCNALKMEAADGKMRFTDVANAQQLLRLIQSIPSPKAEPFKQWLAQVGYERMLEIENPELATQRARELYKAKGYPDGWNERRMVSTNPKIYWYPPFQELRHHRHGGQKSHSLHLLVAFLTRRCPIHHQGHLDHSLNQHDARIPH